MNVDEFVMSSAKIQLTFVPELIPRLDSIPKKFRGIHYLFDYGYVCSSTASAFTSI